MKCVKSHKTSEVIRVSDDKASRLVKSGDYSYSSKDAWKKGGRRREK